MDIELYYINLDKRKDRNENMLKQLSQFKKILWKRHKAFQPSFDFLKNLVDQKMLCPIDYLRVLSENTSYVTKGSIGCFYSHLDLFKKCYESGKIFIILEDDIILDPSFEDYIINALKDIHYDFDMIYFYQPQGLWKKDSSDHSTYFWKINQGYFCTSGYILHPDHAQFLIEKLTTYFNHIDNTILYFNSLFKKNILLMKKIILQIPLTGNRDSDVMIQKKKSRRYNILIPLHFYFVKHNRVQEQIENWIIIHPGISYKIVENRYEAAQKIETSGGFFVAPNLYCSYCLYGLIQYASCIRVDESDDFYGKGKSISDNLLIFPSFFIREKWEKNQVTIMHYKNSLRTP